MRRTVGEMLADQELLLKFYKRENERYLTNLRSRDQFLIERDIFPDYCEWAKEKEKK